MPTVSTISQSPIARYLLDNKAVAKRINRDTVHFVSNENLLLGELHKSGYRGERQVITTIFDKNKNPIFEKVVFIKKYVKDLILNEKNCAVIPEGYTIYSETKDFINNTIDTEFKTQKLISKLKKGNYNCDFPIYNVDGKIKYENVPHEFLTIHSQSIGSNI